MNNLNFKDSIQKYYNDEASTRDGKHIKAGWKIAEREKFCSLAQQNNKQTLLELGAGAGYDSLFFMGSGFDVVAVDISSEMIKKCREKSITAYELDFYNLPLLNKKFDCIYAINTLLHVPKNHLQHVLQQINAVLAEDGFFYRTVWRRRYGRKHHENRDIRCAAPVLLLFR